jgi:hypothetical protein
MAVGSTLNLLNDLNKIILCEPAVKKNYFFIDTLII